MEKYLPSHIANYFLCRAWEEGIKDMTPMKLIKLVCIAYGWHLVLNKDDKRKRLFEENILAWKHGSIIPSIYHEFKEFGNTPIKKGCYMKVFNNTPIVRSDDTDILKILHNAWEQYKNFDGFELSAIIHKGNSWENALKQGLNTRLDDNDIQAFFIKEITKLMKQDENNSKS